MRIFYFWLISALSWLCLSPSLCQARELRFDEGRFYAELAFDLSLLYATVIVHESTRGLPTHNHFFTQPFDDSMSRIMHGGHHKPFQNRYEKLYDNSSTDINNVMVVGTFLSPLLKPYRHRLGSFMTLLHAQEIWLFMSQSLKSIVKRERPKYYYTHDPRDEDPSSFPSGHAGQAFAMAFAADFLFDLPTWAQWSLYTAATTSSVLRILADRHFVSDVVAGAGLAYLGVWTAFYVFEPEEKKPEANTFRLHVEPSKLALSYHF